MSTILVVDDTAIFRDPLAASLRLAGYETACAGNGREALAAVRDRRPDLILLDLAMPVMDGPSFLRELRRADDAAAAAIPVVVLSAGDDQRQAFEAGALGAGDYVLKSQVSLDQVLARVKEVLARGPSAAPASATGSVAEPAAGAAAPGGRFVPVAPPKASAVHLLCPHVTCGRLLTVSPDLRGKLITCSYCGGALRVPLPKKEKSCALPPPPTRR